MFRKFKILLLALCTILCVSLGTACANLKPPGSSDSTSYSDSVSDENTETGDSSTSAESKPEDQPDPTCPHEWNEGYCGKCETFCPHDFSGNSYSCYICNLYCEHQYNTETGKCINCNTLCSHEWSDGSCWRCGKICSHDYQNGYCTICIKPCFHSSWENGICVDCSMECFHQNGWIDGVCIICFKPCEHSFTEGYCYICSYVCTHEYDNKQNTCKVCQKFCLEHTYTDGVCYYCQHVCAHNYTSGNPVCLNCEKTCTHESYTNALCDDCGSVCTHNAYTNGICNECKTVCTHENYTQGVCDTCQYVCPHDFDNGVCDECGLQFSLTYTLKYGYYTVTGSNDNTIGSLTIPATYENKPVKAIAPEAFKNYANLTTVVLPESLEEIGTRAFYNCANITTFNIPTTVTTVGEDILTSYKVLTYENNVCYAGNWVLSYDNTVTTPITVKAGTVGLAENAFRDGGQSTKLSRVSLPASLKYIGKNAFYGCSALEEITIPNGVTLLPAWTFMNCTSLASVTLSASLTTISPYAFENCSLLSQLTIPETVSNVDKTSFNGCTKLIETVNGVKYVDTWAIGYVNATNIAFRSGTTGIAQTAFADCSSLSSVDFSGIKHIGYMAFSGCTALTEIILPDSVLTVGAYAFNRCNQAKTISIGSGIKRIEESTFAKTTSTSISLSMGANVEYLGSLAFYCNIIQPIEFNGTADEWLAIERVPDWCNYFQVHCIKDNKYLNSSGVEYTPNS